MVRQDGDRKVRGPANPSPKRSSREWVLRSGLSVVLLVVAASGLGATLANVIVKAAPSTAYSLAPADGRAAAALAARNFSAAPDAGVDSDQATLARQALRLDPTSVDALNVLAMQAEMRQDQASADRLFAYSVALSRRELQPQIWAIEKAVERGDIKQALTNYDLALRTSRRAQHTLFPVLASALGEPRVRREVLHLLASKAVWTTTFLDYASSRGRSPRAVAELLREGEGRLPITDAHRARVVNGLADQGLINEAWNFFTTFRSGVSRSRSRDPNFKLNVDVPSIFDWTVGSASGLSAALVQGEDGGYLEFSVPASTRAVVAMQTQLLPPGVYRLEGVSVGIDQPENSLPYWTLACRGGAELGRLDVPNSARESTRFHGEFTVPASCPVQTLSLVARASDKPSGVFGQFKRLQLRLMEE